VPNFVKNCQLEAELFHADGWKDRQAGRQNDRQGDIATLIVAFRSYGVEQYGAKGIIFKSTVNTAECFAVVTTV